jgi:hypothetical protein
VNPSFTAFATELLLIKQAEADEPIMTMPAADAAPVQDEELRPFKSKLPTLARERFKSALKFGVGHGLGTGAGFLAGELLLPKVLPQKWTEATRRNVGFATGGLGAIGALALWDAMRQAGKNEEDALKRHS